MSQPSLNTEGPKNYHVPVIYGIGIDVVHIGRLRAVTEKWGRTFLDRVFTERELAYCFGKKNPYPSLSVRFAAKEAFKKAIGAEVPVSLRDIEVEVSDGGKPSLVFGGRIRQFLDSHNITATHVSLTHDHDYGVASVVVER